MIDSHGFITVRDPAQLQRAHDILMGLVDETVVLTDPAVEAIIHEVPTRRREGSTEYGVDLMFQILVAADVLCWVLEDPRQDEFGNLLDGIETLLKKMGYQVNVHAPVSSRSH